jgi:hypothetical protein
MQISELVRDRLGLKYMDDDLRALDGLTGEMIKLHSFHKDAVRKRSPFWKRASRSPVN